MLDDFISATLDSRSYWAIENAYMKKNFHTNSDRFGQRPFSFDFRFLWFLSVHTLCPGLICLTLSKKMKFRKKGFGNYSDRDIKKFTSDLLKKNNSNNNNNNKIKSR